MRAPAANMAARVWAWRSAANWRVCLAAKFNCAARREEEARSRSTCRRRMWVHQSAIASQESRPAVLRQDVNWRTWWSRRVGGTEFPTTATICSPDDAILLIVEDDPHYARVSADLARRQGIQGAGGARAARKALSLAREFHPTAVSLDVFLPDMLGWTVLNHLKQDPTTRHIPVQMLDPGRRPATRTGARRILVCHQADHDRRAANCALDRIKEYRRAATKAVAGCGRQSRRTTQHPASCSDTTTST